MGATGGFGVEFKIGTGPKSGTPTYTAIANVKDIDKLKRTKYFAEITAHDSDGGFEEWIPTGKRKVEQFTLELVFDPTQATHSDASGGLQYADENDTLLAYQIIFPDTSSTTWTFDAYIESFEWSSKQLEEWRAMVLFRPTGQPTLT